MFDLFKPKDDQELTSLDLRTPAPRPAPKLAPAVSQTPAKPAAQPSPAPPCVQLVMSLEGAYAHFGGTHRKFDEIVKSGLKPALLFYLVFPQQGHAYTLTSTDGAKTILPMFTSQAMADAYIAAKKMGAVSAACRLENLALQADRWVAAGCNSYALNLCCRCLSMVLFGIADLQSESAFLANWRVDLANRRHYAETYGRNASAVLSTNPKQARLWLEGLRDHVDAANPYVHWMIAILVGQAKDSEAGAYAACIARLEAFGPPFVGRLSGTSFILMEPSQTAAFAEAIVGLGVSLGYLKPPDKMPEAG